MSEITSWTSEDNYYKPRNIPHLELEGQTQFVTFCLKAQNSTLLSNPQAAEIVKNSLEHFNGQRYDLLAWVIMPNHVHIILKGRDGFRLSRFVQSLKKYTARSINRLYGSAGPVWQKDYWDQYIRNKYHLESALHYVLNNPLNAGLIEESQKWPWVWSLFDEEQLPTVVHQKIDSPCSDLL